MCINKRLVGLVLSISVCMIISSCFFNKKSVGGVKSFMRGKMELYYVDNGCIIPNICFSLYKAKYGLLLKMYDLPNDFDSHNPVNDTCAVGTGTKNKRIGKRPNTKELFYLLSFCLKKASEKYDISNIKIIAVSSDVFPEISIQCTNLLKYHPCHMCLMKKKWQRR